MTPLKKHAICTQLTVVVDNLIKDSKIPISYLDTHVTNVGQQETNVHVEEKILCQMN